MKVTVKNGCIGSLIGGTLLLLALAMASDAQDGKPPLLTTLLQGFEEGLGGWKAANDDSYNEKRYAQKVERSPRDASTEGQHALKGIFNVTRSDGAAIFCTEDPLDLSAASALMFDIYVSEPKLKVALTVSTGDNWDWHESRPLPLAMGWTKMTFPLDQGFKAARSGWTYTVGVGKLSDVRRLGIIIFPDRNLQGELFLDNLRAAKAAP